MTTGGYSGGMPEETMADDPTETMAADPMGGNVGGRGSLPP